MTNFAQLWNNHPDNQSDMNVFLAEAAEDGSAEKMASTLQRCGLALEDGKGVSPEQRQRFTVCAQQLAHWLAAHQDVLHTRMQKFIAEPALPEIEGEGGIKNRPGIVFVQNYWGDGERGSHIDLWDGSRLTGRLSWQRVIHRASTNLCASEHHGSVHRKPVAVWFWPLQ
jgi:hypothetical protein